ncbi:MAG: aminopeptidase P family protein [Planctomycetota bacterium]|nr:MAG: aminopeptidase P family protein [Planctomycetota bacterium]REJ97076.1 MAG: aminopeptidase P family protein [Planctomycetota bacterium]REK20573.1 MAG: aminopeptidase P family protein [Planctomycetota bacterium]REK35102.1 MAG: aminopeptidase P family protein [Planctomycetota bacterium]
MNRHETRRGKLLRIIQREKLDAFLVTSEVNVSYLTGFSGDSSCLLVRPESTLIVSDFRYTTQLEEECPGLDTLIRTTDVKLPEAVVESLKRAKPRLRRVGIESHVMSVELQNRLSGELEDIEFVPVSSAIENEIRAVKDAGEIDELRTAVHLAERGLEYLKAILTPDLTERDASFELEHALRRLGADGFSFPAIIAVGDRAALPHYRPGLLRIGDAGILLVDWGAKTASGYRSDLTRTLVTGKASSKLEKVYNIVLEAQEAAIAAIRPGIKCEDVDRIARDVIAEAGYGKRFGHGLGHGIGLDIHEQPRFAPKSPMELKAGMVVTVEPGIYLPGWGGVRIEDDVLVTRTGAEVLSQSLPKRFDDMILSL